MILVDTSAWIDLLGRRPKLQLSPARLLDVATCGPVIQEVLQGVREDRAHLHLRDSMLALPRLSDPVPNDLYLQAADLYRAGRRRGLTIRSTVDCLIAAIALTHRTPVWHVDRDFDALATFSDLRVHPGRSL